MGKTWVKAIGWTLHGLIGGLLIFAGSGKVFGFAPAPVVENMTKYGLGDKMVLIGAGELISTILLLIPRTRSLGLLLLSGFWGGVICIHMANGEDFVFPSVLLALTWLGGFLRDPRTLASFFDAKTKAPAERRPVAATIPAQI